LKNLATCERENARVRPQKVRWKGEFSGGRDF